MTKVNKDNLIEMFNETLEEYEDYIDKEFELSEGWDDEVFYMITLRESIHDLVLKMTVDSTAFDKSRLINDDLRWQNWIKNNTDNNFAFTFSRDDKPKSEWWWWIDKLPELSVQDLHTI